jgi:nucleoside-diphosphate-sugar epimerase
LHVSAAQPYNAVGREGQERSVSKILVVGGAGYVGSILTRELLERGYAVRVVDRLYFGDESLREVRDRIDLVVADVRALPAEVFRDVDGVVNVAGLSNDPTAEYNPTANYEMNTVASVRLAEHCRQAGIRRYVFASSCSIYDLGVGDEGRDVVLDETTEVRPRAAYASSKFAAEQQLLAMAAPDFCPVVLRKGTIFGFSPRMRYDLVVNTFVKDALSRGAITIYCGGEMWRPLLDIRDAARAYIAGLEADEELVRGQIFNVAFQNVRISELALRARTVLRGMGINVDIVPDYSYRGVRSYRVSARKIQQVLGFTAKVDIEEAVREMVLGIRRYQYVDFDNPRYYNIRWMQFLEEAERTVAVTGSVFGAPPAGAARPRLVAAPRKADEG